MVQKLLAHWQQYCPLSHQEWQWLEQHAHTGQVPRGGILYEPGSDQAEVFIAGTGLLATASWDEWGNRSIARFILPYHAALTHYSLYSRQPVQHYIYALRKSSYISLPIDALKHYKEQHEAASTLVHILMARSGKQYHIKNHLMLVSNEVERYQTFYRHAYMKPFLQLTSQVEQADYLGISRMSIHRALKLL